LSLLDNYCVFTLLIHQAIMLRKNRGEIVRALKRALTVDSVGFDLRPIFNAIPFYDYEASEAVELLQTAILDNFQAGVDAALEPVRRCNAARFGHAWQCQVEGAANPIVVNDAPMCPPTHQQLASLSEDFAQWLADGWAESAFELNETSLNRDIADDNPRDADLVNYVRCDILSQFETAVYCHLRVRCKDLK
jgi:hypothetical protein